MTFRVFLLIILLAVFAPLSPVWAASVNNVRFGVHPGQTRMVLDISGIKSFRVFTMSSPYRIAVDLPVFDWRVGMVDKVHNSGVSGIRQGPLTSDVSRVVVDLNGPAIIKSAFIIPARAGQGERLVVDFAQVSAEKFASARTEVFGTLKSGGTAMASIDPPPPKPVAPPSSVFEAPEPEQEPVMEIALPRLEGIPGQKPLIVIDAGHGGIDPGALGANGVFEKHVALGMAKALKKQLEAGGRYRVMLTRSGDTYLKLGQRVEFARKNKADLFISLHADSVDRPGVQGASVYSLSEKASDAQTAKLAARENQADAIGGIDMGAEDEQVAGILVDLVMRDTMNQSNFFANTLVSAMRQNSIQTLDNAHRSAGFAVLKAPDIPSVLIELGYMTNKNDCARLCSPSYQQKMAQILAGGIDRYFQKTIASR